MEEIVLWAVPGVLLWAFTVAWFLLPVWFAERARKAAGKATETTQEPRRDTAGRDAA